MIEKIVKYVDNAKVIDPHACILFLIALVYGLDYKKVIITDADIQLLSIAGIISLDPDISLKVNFYKFKKEKDDFIEQEVEERYQEVRDCFKGLFTGSMGSPEAVKNKLILWRLNNPNYSFDDIVNAAKTWVENKKMEVSDPSYIGQADYFIYKKEKDGVVSSRLSSIIDDLPKTQNYSTIL